MKLLLFVSVLLPLVTSGQYSSKDNTHYLAAVVEYLPEYNVTLQGLPLVLENIRHYEQLITAASSQGVDIIVFPEAGLTGVVADRSKRFFSKVPHPYDSVCPCLQPNGWAEPITRLSCAARANRIYVVVNLYEQNGTKRHNTNVVFNRDGDVVSRYRKLHLFNEDGLQVPDEKEFSVFHTDFGVTFGVFICFDLVFHEPASALSHTRNITHFVYSTAWFSEVPFLTAVQAQAAWSWSHNSVLLASGLNGPLYGNTGSGIYVGRMGPMKTIFTGQEPTQLLIGRVPKDINVKHNCGSLSDPQPELEKKHIDSISFGKLHLLNDWIHAFATQLLPLYTTEEQNIKLCHETFCCDFKVRKEVANTHSHLVVGAGVDVQPYRLFVWNGVRDFGGAATGGVQLCGVVACINASDLRTCGRTSTADQFPWKVKFSKLEIRGAFDTGNATMLLPNTMDRRFLPLPTCSFDLTESGCGEIEDVKCVNMTLLREEDEIETFAIYNRVFGRDGSNYTHTKPESSSSVM